MANKSLTASLLIASLLSFLSHYTAELSKNEPNTQPNIHMLHRASAVDHYSLSERC